MAPAQAIPTKLPPCDQCRRRKVRCDAAERCDRCTQSGLRCTRDIIRKRRGPKKGSGSVIARLRVEDDQTISQDVTLPPFQHLSSVEAGEAAPGGISRSISQDGTQLPPIRRTFHSNIEPTSDPASLNLRLITQVQPLPSISATSLLSQNPNASPRTNISSLGSPLPWRVASPFEPYQSFSTGSNGFVTINELARRIFNTNNYSSMSYPFDSDANLADATPPSQTPPVRPTSINAILSSAASPHSQSSAQSPYDAQQATLLFRTPSNSNDIRVQALAAEVGMSANLMSHCIRAFFSSLYPVMPVIHEATFRRRMTRQDELSLEEKCQVLAMCAATVLHAGPQDLNLDSKKKLATQFIERFLDVRKQYDFIENATLVTMIASLFVAICFFELKKAKSHHFYLREAIGMALEQGLHLESFYSGVSHLQEICHRRTFALLFVTERGAAILRSKPIAISAIPNIPEDHFDDEDPAIIAGFQCLCRLFALLDEKFVAIWRDSQNENMSLRTSLANIASLQHSLRNMSFESVGLTDIQKVCILDVSIVRTC